MNKRSMIKKERVIDLTDFGHNNTMPVVRELRSLSDQTPGQADAITFINEERDNMNLQGPNLQDPDGQFEEQLEASGATIIKSETYYPASRTTITKRSMTPQEHAEERGYYL